ncbi:hypothetical protein TOPH_01955 [Tolypocladium ophioglossoides CBS 100239]|uniref:Uncharacterized protein n=1 Tax=Tolypocladium ophioglossoides (strain CBS 100239) TaxID=1163406 RepID=A0A0L0NHC4_TOLOC|nr:hypothetical protein TOPH_01955 [Tolypocladium ophioglossoides CBS 100239]
MAEAARLLACFEACRLSLSQITRNVQKYQFNATSLVNAKPSTDEYSARAAIVKEMESVAENLGAFQDNSTQS